jgi:hypothetical protein
MINYQVHFEYPAPLRSSRSRSGCLRRGMRTIKARNELEAIIKVKSVVEGSFGHWINRLANEEAI